MSKINYSKEYFLEILRSKSLFKKKKDEIKESLKVDLNQSEQIAKQKSEIAKNLTLACYDILSKKEENGVYKLSSMLIIKDVMDIGQQFVLMNVSTNLLGLIKSTVIQYSGTEPVGIQYLSDKPSIQFEFLIQILLQFMSVVRNCFNHTQIFNKYILDETESNIGQLVVGRMLECIFTWACWHFKNSNGTKTRFFLAFEECLKEGVEFPEEEKFIYFTRDEIFRFQGKQGFEAVLYLEDLVDLQYQIKEAKAFLQSQFDVSEVDVDQAKMQECLNYIEDIYKEYQTKQLDSFFPDDKIIYQSEMWFFEKILPKFKSYKNKKITFQEFKLSASGFIEKHEEYKSKAQSNARQQSQSNVTANQSNTPANQSTVATNKSQGPQNQQAEPTPKTQQNQSQNRSAEQNQSNKQQQQQQQQQQQYQQQQQSQLQQSQQQQLQQQQQQYQQQAENFENKNSRPLQSGNINQSTSQLKNNGQLQTDEDQQQQQYQQFKKNSIDKKNDSGQRNPNSYTQLNEGDKRALEEMREEKQKNQKIINLQDLKIKDYEDKVQKFESRLQNLENELSQQKNARQQQNDHIESLESQLQEARMQNQSQKNQSTQKNNEEISRLQQKVNDIGIEKDNLKSKITYLQSQLEDAEREKTFIQSKKNEKDQESAQKNYRIEELEKQVQEYEQNMQSEQEKMYELMQEKENEMIAEKINLEEENKQLKIFLQELEYKQQEHEQQKRQNQQLIANSKKAQEENNQQLIQENEEQKVLISQLQQMVTEEEEKANQLKREYSMLLRDNQTLKDDLNNIKSSQNKVSQESYNLQILENQIQILTEKNKELEHQLQQAELQRSAAPSNYSNHDYYDRSSYQQKVQDYDNKINELQTENHNIPMLQQKVKELESLINIQQRNDAPISKEQEKSYSQIKKVLAEAIEKSKQLDTQINSFMQTRQSMHLQPDQQALANRSSSAQNFRNTAPQGFYSVQNQDFDQSRSSSQHMLKNPFASTFRQEHELKHYQTQPNFYQPNASKIRLSQINNIKNSKLYGMASTTSGFQNSKPSFEKKTDQIVQDDSLALPEKYEEDESQSNQSVASLNDIRDLRQIDKVGADLIFPFRNPKMYYSNKAKLKDTKGKMIPYNDALFSYIRFPKDTIYKFKRACLKQKFSIFENEDLQIGQISNYEVINNQYIVKLGIYLTNKTDIDVTNLSINYLHSNRVQMWKDEQITMTSLSAKKQLKQSLTVFFNIIPYEVVIADVEYRCHGFNQKFQVPIPCLITKYLEIQVLDNSSQFKSLWDETSKFNLIRSEDCYVNKQIAKSPQDFLSYFPYFLNLNPEKANQYNLGLNDYVMGGQIYLRQPNVTFLLKIYLKPNNMIQFKIASGSEMEDRNVVEFFLQNLLYIYTIQQ